MEKKKAVKKKVSKKSSSPGLKKAVSDFHKSGKVFLRTVILRAHARGGKTRVDGIKTAVMNIEKSLDNINKKVARWK